MHMFTLFMKKIHQEDTKGFCPRKTKLVPKAFKDKTTSEHKTWLAFVFCRTMKSILIVILGLHCLCHRQVLADCVQEARDYLSEAEDDLSSAEAEVQAAEDLIDDAEDALGDAEADLAECRGDLRDLEDRLARLEAEKREEECRLEAIGEAVAALDDLISELEDCREEAVEAVEDAQVCKLCHIPFVSQKIYIAASLFSFNSSRWSMSLQDNQDNYYSVLYYLEP